MNRLAVFASGGGSNAQKIMEYFEHHTSVKVVVVVTNNPEAGVIGIAERFGISVCIISRTDFRHEEGMSNLLASYGVDYIILAGFLWLLPPFLIKHFPDRILNIHPSLLPAYGGKGMYGHFVHEAVFKAGEKETGCTMHVVNEAYDDGQILFQAVCPITPGMKPSEIANAVLKLEHTYYAAVIENYIIGTYRISS
jgi:phosphoribosylglycinamide formyltransferase-1